jgi:predicted ribosomally synthesized peptide with nif11-like leader
MEADESFAQRVKEAGGPDASIAMLESEGFDVSKQDMRDAALDRFGDALSPQQLDEVAAGADVDWSFIATVSVMSIAAYGAVAAAV